MDEQDRSAGWTRVYDATGKTVCKEDPCRLPAAGTYTAVVNGLSGYPYHDESDGLVVYDRAADTGCTATGTGLYKGELSAVGQYDCLTLASPQGASLAALTPLSSGGVQPEVEVVDRDGTVQCGSDKLRGGNCALTGTAPFRALVHTSASGDTATGPYAIAFHRTDALSECPVLPAGSFAADGAKATLTTGDGVFSHCLSIPADAHTADEVFQLTAVSGDAPAEITVVDSGGNQTCRLRAGTSWGVCPLTPGKAHTVFVTGSDRAATYTLTRRDVTATASGCAAAAAVPVGGPSAHGESGGALSCRQVTTGATTDVLHLGVRVPQGTVKVGVYGADGKGACTVRNNACSVTGSTSYQVLVQATSDYRLDALRLATADGPAPECTRVPSVAYGYGPVTGRLDETRTAVCAVLPTKGLDYFSTDIKDTTGAAATAVPFLYDTVKWADHCTRFTDGVDCSAGGSTNGSAPTVLLLGLPANASSTSYSAGLTCMSTPCGPDSVSVTGISPATGVSGTKVKVTVTGTALGPNTEVRLGLAGKTVSAKADSVAADNRSVTATLDLTGVAAGTWNVSVFTTCCEYPRGTFTVTQPRLTGTAAPKITGTAKVGARVTATTGSWSATPTSYTYQWKADGKAISGATAAAYTVPAALLGKKLTVTVTAVKSGWISGTATSAAVTVAKGDAPKATRAPTVGGTAKVGKKLTAAHGTWSPAATSYAYQWYANGKAISGATKSTLTLKAAQKGKKITVKVTAHRTGHKDGTATSRPTKAVTG